MVAIEGRQVLVILVALLSASYKSSASEVSGEVEKAKLDIYYETLCPSSAKFIVEHLPKLFNSGLIHVTHLKLFPYGNADVFNGTIYCQHGQLECLLNTVQACAIDVWPDLDEYLPFINCVENVVLESFVYRRKYPQWQTCFEKLNLEAKPVTNCHGSARGKELELLYANETQALQPPQTPPANRCKGRGSASQGGSNDATSTNMAAPISFLFLFIASYASIINVA